MGLSGVSLLLSHALPLVRSGLGVLADGPVSHVYRGSVEYTERRDEDAPHDVLDTAATTGGAAAGDSAATTDAQRQRAAKDRQTWILLAIGGAIGLFMVIQGIVMAVRG